MHRAPTLGWSLLATYLRPQRGRVGLLALLLFGSIGLQLLNPQILRFFLDTAQAGGPQAALLQAAVLFIGIGLLQRAVTLGTAYVSQNVAWTATNRLRADLALHCLRLDMAFHKTHTPGALIERVDGDVTSLANFFSQLVIRVLGNALLIGAVLVLVCREDWRLGLALTLYMGLTLAALAAVQNAGVRRWTASRENSAAQYGFLEERLTGLEDIRANGAEPYLLAQLHHYNRQTLLRVRAARMVGHLQYVSTRALLMLGYAIGLGGGAYLYQQGTVTIGTVFLLVAYIGMLGDPLENIRGEAQDLQQATASMNRVQALFRTPRQVQEAPRASLPAGPLAVAFQDVSFRYDPEILAPAGPDAAGAAPSPSPTAEDAAIATRPDGLVLRDITFTLPPGRVLGLLGRTGSGKTTLTRLLFRLYDPTSGAIRLDDVAIRAVGLADLRGRVGLVTQDVQLFQATVRDNVAFFSQGLADARIDAALAELGLREWAGRLPQGLDTVLAAGGAGLSAGEGQLLAFTRVLLKDPGLVILDEASSRLDPLTEHLLEQAVDRLLARRTGIIIAHRLRTVRRADDIMILEDGRVVEYGPREQLAHDPSSHFYRLLQTGLEEALA